MSEAVDSSNKKISSILTEDTKLGDENIKLKVEVDALRMEIDRQHQNN